MTDFSQHFTTKMLLRFSLPVMGMMLFTSCYGIVDGLFVSNFVGKTAFAAVTITMPFVMILSTIGIMMGTGGTPEGVISACAIKGLGGQIFGRFDPQSQAERDIMIKEGTNLDEVLSVESLIRADDAFFAATGISGGTFLGGVSYTGTGAVTHSLMIRAKTGTFRYLEAHHNLERLMKFSSVRYD
jgi:fructose-1,6-bisphosphatase/sedoheptulose 1,7-bisphosphatase-like protein